MRVDSVYYAPSTTVEHRASFARALDAARARLFNFYGSLRATPVIIVADAQHVERFSDGATGVTHYQPWGATIVLGPAGQNVDVIAHELAHAELFARVGYRRLAWCVPTWFDEGLAVQFDRRSFYSEASLAKRVAQGSRVPVMSALTSHAAFFAGSRDSVRFHYAAARAVVSTWLRQQAPGAALRALSNIECGGNWDATLRAIARGGE